jgi:hypothetical protein
LAASLSKIGCWDIGFSFFISWPISWRLRQSRSQEK